jgi:hypothetical protein
METEQTKPLRIASKCDITASYKAANSMTNPLKRYQIYALATVLLTAAQAHAWSYDCGSQKVSGKILQALHVTDAYGQFVSLSYHIGDQQYSIPTMLPDGGEENTFFSHDEDVEVVVNPVIDDEDTIGVYLKIKSLGIHGEIECSPSL